MTPAAIQNSNPFRPGGPAPGVFEYSFAWGIVAFAIVVALISVVVILRRKRVAKAADDPGDLGTLEWERPEDSAGFRRDVGQGRSEPPGKDSSWN